MRDGMFIFDNVVHMYDNSAVNVVDREQADRSLTRPLYHEASSITDGDRFKSDPDFMTGQLDVDRALRGLFVESQTDMAMAQAVPIAGFWREGFFPISRNHALKEACPERILFCGGFDPIGMSLPAALREMERQVDELGAVSFKFYQSNAVGQAWAADDRELAYPIWEKALQLGVKVVQFHKGQPFGEQILGPAFQALDLQKPARDFPELEFVVHHLGTPYIDETINIASRFPNIHLALTAWLNGHAFAPIASYHQLGKALMYVGADRLLYGSEAFIFPSIQSYIEVLDSLDMPEELQDGYGYPQVTREVKEKIFGLNFARMMGVDVEAKRAELAGVSRVA